MSTALSLSLDQGYAEATSANHLVYKTIDPLSNESTFHAVVSFRDHVSDVPVGYPSRFAAAEMMGIAITTRREFFDALDPKAYRRALDAMSLPERNFRRLTQRIRKEARAKEWAALRLELSAASELISAFYQYLNPADLFGFSEVLTDLRQSRALATLHALSHRRPDVVRSRLEGLRQGYPITATPLTPQARRLPWISPDEKTDFKNRFDHALDDVLGSLKTTAMRNRQQRSA